MGWTNKDQGSMPGRDELISKASRLASGSGPVQLPTQWVSGLFLQGKRCQNMKLTTHHAPLPTLPPPPRAELYHNPCHAFMACRHSFTQNSHHTFIPELESGNRAATYTQVSAKCHKHTTHSSFLCTWLLAQTHSTWPNSPQSHAMTINKVPWIQGVDITYLIDITISSGPIWEFDVEAHDT
jgi:hypothetical protein